MQRRAKVRRYRAAQLRHSSLKKQALRLRIPLSPLLYGMGECHPFQL
jgi:hypothetical protein